ncbi:MAG: hypothetical protein D6719_09615 [Candidatus Dadabacteria bacterium]|nr:MAG: hypothetical protein D6719_09615 [Candidatus Dadabacteria bacterium]
MGRITVIIGALLLSGFGNLNALLPGIRTDSEGYFKRRAALSGLRVVSIGAYDQNNAGEGGSREYSIDVTKDTCGTAPDTTDEPFYDTVVGISLSNSSLVDVNVKRVRFVIPKVASGRLRSAKLTPFGSGIVPAGASNHEILAFLLDVQGSSKALAGTSDLISDTTGSKTVRVILRGRDASGRRFVKRARTTFIFRNVNRCQ